MVKAKSVLSIVKRKTTPRQFKFTSKEGSYVNPGYLKKHSVKTLFRAFSARKRSCVATENGEKIEEVSSDESHHQDSSPHQDLLATEKKAASTVRDFLTVLALSLHAVFEGLAVGLGSSTTEVWTLYAGRTNSKRRKMSILTSQSF